MGKEKTGASRASLGYWLSAGSLGATALMLASGVRAQTAAATPTSTEEIVVTASRIQTGGFSAPTPTMVLSEAQLKSVAPLQVQDMLAQVPSFRTTGQSATASFYPDLRGIGSQRTLVLVNGRRHVPTFSDGTVDLGVIPAILLKRSEVVTGGASASWGSGAVAGVINLILKNDLEGIEGTAQAGISSRGDSRNFLVALAGGTSFADGRGHVLVGGEYSEDKGIRSLQQPYLSRPWAGTGSVGNSAFATNGLPGTIYSTDTRRADVSPGGLITSGPLRGTTFLGNGQTRQFGYGTVYGNNMIGGTDNFGDAPTPGGDLKYPYTRYSVMGRVSFEVSNALNLFAEGSLAYYLSNALTFPPRNNGAITGNPTCTTTTTASGLGSLLVNINNPFLPTSVHDAAVAAGVTCFNMGKVFREDGLGDVRTADGSPSIWRGVVGAEGEIFSGWKYSAYYQYGRNRFQQNRIGNINVAKFRNAIDAVKFGSTISCRINTDANTTNDDPACAPYDLFGPDAASAAAKAYVSGTSWFQMVTKQEVGAASLSGNLFSTWAGPIGAAFGAEWRKESIDAVADPISQANGWQSTNRKAIVGSFTVKEVFGEIAVPLARDWAFAKALDLNLAIRYTDYSSSGSVTTWKIGATWDVNDDIRFRVSQSRDIRAGNLSELFTPTAVQANNVRDPRTAAVIPVPVTTIGNPSLKPERADTFTGGVVVQPSWFPGLRASIDYYNIDISGQIGTITPNQVLERCFLDNLPQFCAQVTQNGSGTITGVTVNFQNLDRFKTEGVDIEVSYRTPVSLFGTSGALSGRVLANYTGKLATTAAVNATTVDLAGQVTQPHWTIFGLATYEGKRVTTTLDMRWYQGGTIDNTRVEGQASAVGVNINHTRSTFYTNLAVTADLSAKGDKAIELFARVNNLFDRAPPFPITGEGASIFDVVGRAYRAGVRFKL
ncbi:MAG: TonB-dependent receptor [Sphingobium sp.]|nr:TonB-dependent receptor [Sphingobium sp.]